MLVVDKIRKTQGKFTLDNISFSLKEGFVLGIIGENGAGKTTLINSILNLKKLDSGSIEIFGKNLLENEEEIKKDIGFVFDEDCFFENLSIKEMTLILKKYYKNWDNQYYNKYLKLFKLDEKSKIGKLSKGNKMKYQILTALSHKGKLIVMDEPTAGLDPSVRVEVLNILQEYIEENNASIIFSTHITSDLEKIADYIVFLKEGKMVFFKSMEEVKEEFYLVKENKENIEYLKGKALGYENTKYTSTFLMKKEDIPKDSQYEVATLEDIMYYYKRF